MYRLVKVKLQRHIYVEKKISLKNDDVIYQVRLSDPVRTSEFEYIYLKAKTFGKALINDNAPVFAFLRPRVNKGNVFEELSLRDFSFHGWGYVLLF